MRLCLAGATGRSFHNRGRMPLPQTAPKPAPPAFMLNADFASRIAIRLTKRQMSRLLSSTFKEGRDELRKQLGLSESEAKEMMLYFLQVSRIACNEIFDELEERYRKDKDE